MLQIIAIAWKNVYARPGRSLLTAISLFIGVLAIVIIQAGSSVALNVVVADAVLSNGKLLTVGFNAEASRQNFIKNAHLIKLLNKELGPVSGHAAMQVDLESVSLENKNVNLSLVTPNLRAIRPFPVKAGKWLKQTSLLVLPIVINEPAQKLLGKVLAFPLTLKLKELNIKFKTKVVGVVSDGSKEANAYARLNLKLPWVKELAYLKPVKILVHANSYNLNGIKTLIQNEYKRIFDTDNDVDVVRYDTQENFAETIATIAFVFLIVASLSLAVGSLSILNIGLATLKERSDELLLRRAFGATKLQVAAIIILEGQIIAIITALLALYVGNVTFPFFASFMSPAGFAMLKQNFPITTVLTAIAISCLAAFLGSLIPAIRAARLPISSVMRN